MCPNLPGCFGGPPAVAVLALTNVVTFAAAVALLLELELELELDDVNIDGATL